jgi:glycosyltransferase involved in cell wall biosynthesis
MKVLIVNTSDIDGGAARAAFRLHDSLLNIGVDSFMLVQKRNSNNFRIFSPTGFFYKYLLIFKSIFDYLPLIFYRRRQRQIFSTSWLSSPKIIKIINKTKPDIVHLHWINEGLLSINDLEKIEFPIVWSLHDNWAFTGGCHVKWDCNNFLNKCGNCPILQSKYKYDLSWINYKRKEFTFKNIQHRTTIICLSNWMMDNAKRSILLERFQIQKIPNPINTNYYNILDKNICRKLYDLPENKKILLFGALNPINDINKGYYLLKEAVNLLNNNDYLLVIFGMAEDQYLTDLRLEYRKVGVLKDDLSLKILYNSADVFLVPSLQENLSNSIMESLSCGVPVVAFDTGGNSDLVINGENGFLAKNFDPLDFSYCITEVLNNKNINFSLNARKHIVNNFDYSIVATKYFNMYNEILSK